MPNKTSPATRKRVLDAARKLLISKGMEATSIADICKASGVSNGSVFHHFGSKEAIALAIFAELRREYWLYVLDAMEACESVPDAAEASVRAAFAFQREQPEAFAFMQDTSAAPWLLRQTAPLRELNAAFAERAMKWAAPHIAAGRLPMLSIQTFGALIFGLPQWIGREARAGLAKEEVDRAADELAALMRKLFSA